MATNTGAVSASYVGVPSLLYAPAVRKQIIARYPDHPFVDYLDQVGAWDRITETQYYTAFNTPLFNSVSTTSSTVTNSGTATVTVTDLTTANSNILIVGKLVRWYRAGTLYTGRVQTKTQAAGKDTVTITSTKAGAPNLVLVAGDTLYPYSNAQEEGSLKPDPERRGLETIHNLMQIFRVTGETTDIARMRNSRGSNFLVEMPDGQIGSASWQEAFVMMLHRAEIGNALLLGELSAANFTDDTPEVAGARGYGVQTTKGMIPHVRDYGWTANLTSLGTPTVADWEAAIAAIVARRGADEYTLFGGRIALTRMSSFFKNLGSGGVTSVQMNVNGRKLDLTVDQFTYGGVVFNMKPLDALDNQQIIPTSDPISKTLYAVPTGMTESFMGGRRKTVPYLGAKYGPVTEPGDGTEKNAVVNLGALAPRPTEGTAVLSTTDESIAGLDFTNPYTSGSIQVLA